MDQREDNPTPGANWNWAVKPTQSNAETTATPVTTENSDTKTNQVSKSVAAAAAASQPTAGNSAEDTLSESAEVVVPEKTGNRLTGDTGADAGRPDNQADGGVQQKVDTASVNTDSKFPSEWFMT
jgi:hypothetical protein